ncbi:hypothetical protein N7488_011820 [Penicillium malachiteum]|nr:hypothetical protein N7488_011820 [Penicillium malachiteum]
MGMHHRRAHTKSRHGCTTCKTRRVKCDEQRPICGNCSSRNETCAYPGSGPFFFTGSQGRRSRKKASSEDRQSNSESPSFHDFNQLGHSPTTASYAPTLDMKQLELVLQWINETHKLPARNEETRKVLEKIVLQEALTTPFLMHGILAISALHLSHLRRDDRHEMWLDIAIAHKNTALAMFSEQLQNIGQSNAKAMMIFAGLAFAFSMATALNLDTTEDGPGLNSLTNVFQLARGVQTIVNEAGSSLKESEFAPLFDITPPDVSIPARVIAALDQLDQLQAQCSEADPSIDSAAYAHAIQRMRRLVAFTFDSPMSMTMAGGWAISCPPAFLDDLNSRRPLALVVLAHYCVFLHMGRGNWSIGSWGYKVFSEITQELEPHWHPHIEWAARHIMSSDP